jgi:hypothetical protein
MQCFIHSNQFAVSLRRPIRNLVQIDVGGKFRAPQVSSALRGRSHPRRVHQNPPHHRRRRTAAVPPRRRRPPPAADRPRLLWRWIGACGPLSRVPAGRAGEFVIDLRDQSVHCRLLAGAPRFQQLGNLCRFDTGHDSEPSAPLLFFLHGSGWRGCAPLSTRFRKNSYVFHGPRQPLPHGHGFVSGVRTEPRPVRERSVICTFTTRP